MATFFVLDSKLAVVGKTDSFDDAHRLAAAVGLVTEGEVSVLERLALNVAPTARPDVEDPILKAKLDTRFKDAEALVAAAKKALGFVDGPPGEDVHTGGGARPALIPEQITIAEAAKAKAPVKPVKPLNLPKPAKPAIPATTRDEREAELDALPADEVKRLAEKAGLPHGTKAEAIDCLLDAEF